MQRAFQDARDDSDVGVVILTGKVVGPVNSLCGMEEKDGIA